MGTAFAIEATPADREAIEKVCQQYLLDYNATLLLGKAPAADYFAAGTAAEYQIKKLELQRQETMLAHQQVPVEKIIEERFTVQEISSGIITGGKLNSCPGKIFKSSTWAIV